MFGDKDKRWHFIAITLRRFLAYWVMVIVVTLVASQRFPVYVVHKWLVGKCFNEIIICTRSVNNWTLLICKCVLIREQSWRTNNRKNRGGVGVYGCAVYFITRFGRWKTERGFLDERGCSVIECLSSPGTSVCFKHRQICFTLWFWRGRTSHVPPVPPCRPPPDLHQSLCEPSIAPVIIMNYYRPGLC